jgi:flagellar motor switch protein FliN/FliY
MSASTGFPADPTAAAAATAAPGGATQNVAAPNEVSAKAVDFAELSSKPSGAGTGSLDRLLDVKVNVTVELGRASTTIGEVLKLGVGSVLELDRAVSEPVDLMAQGVRLARGEVVVVDDRFAIRIKEIAEPKKRAA